MEELVIAHIIATTFFPALHENKNSIGYYVAMKKDYMSNTVNHFSIKELHIIAEGDVLGGRHPLQQQGSIDRYAAGRSILARFVAF
ncbi:hypothetical protein Lsai_0792 [Legionella sainthelensi]|uniref:Uncharacterized protein n=1 Tax=Legionella sainthelensi TaxID=28087 RepID=A0A0W0YMR0_9GAMM|nr:hypothetical protein [Legionella sainthelensi]KTD58185.1 hypothetical protein Lsai_0792 [Legionella sainthelensi]VEH26740.1 Uncharacterised protein [Legionella sainthelensi]